MIQDIIVVSSLDNGYLVLTANHHNKKSTHMYCANETAVAEEVYTRLSGLLQETGRMTTAELEALTAPPTSEPTQA